MHFLIKREITTTYFFCTWYTNSLIPTSFSLLYRFTSSVFIDFYWLLERPLRWNLSWKVKTGLFSWVLRPIPHRWVRHRRSFNNRCESSPFCTRSHLLSENYEYSCYSLSYLLCKFGRQVKGATVGLRLNSCFYKTDWDLRPRDGKDQRR